MEWLAILDADPMRSVVICRSWPGSSWRRVFGLGRRWVCAGVTSTLNGRPEVERTVVRLKGKGLVASRLKSRSSYRVLVMPGWCLTMLRRSDGPVLAS